MSNSPFDPATQQPWHPTGVVEQKPEGNGFSQWWYSFTTPPPPIGTVNFVKREAERKARLLSNVACFFLVVLLLFFPACFFMGIIVVGADTIAIVGTVIGLIVNRGGKSNLAGVVIVLGAEIALATAIVGMLPFHPADIQLYDLYVLIILLAVSLLPARYIFLLALTHCVFIVAGLLLLPARPELAHDLQIQAQLLPAIVRPVGLQLLTSGVAYIWVSSATRAIERANRAEMVAMLEHTIAEERASTEREKQELEESIQQLIQTHIAATQGQMANQIPYPPAKVLWPLVGAINSLWARLQRTHHIEREYQSLRQAITSYIPIIQKNGNASLPLVSTGTILDQVILAAQTKGKYETQQKFSQTDPYQSTKIPQRG